MNEDAKVKTLEYVSKAGYKGVLYNWHYDDWTGEWNYSMSIKDKDGYEVLHAYNATPKTMDELKKVVNEHPSMVHFLMNMAEYGHP